ncbi:hypothetical protein [Motilimonas pumila]|uniref:Uncharacterized protein n=1 Tax=Motilimonas pumila TaxID=2303987 RepID=A0A418YBC5_9GAMM|nr:hypothetical protein [Motilimonas pumila]RJG40281.1 hypothetical protein D1Z90_16110 [Motilimonas pumila]
MKTLLQAITFATILIIVETIIWLVITERPITTDSMMAFSLSWLALFAFNLHQKTKQALSQYQEK